LLGTFNLKIEKQKGNLYLILKKAKTVSSAKAEKTSITKLQYQTSNEVESVDGITSVKALKVESLKQERTINGKITGATGESLPGVNVVVKGTTVGTITDTDGRYNINVPNGSNTLIFSFVGYQSQEMTIGNQTSIDVLLKEDITALEELVVVGYGAVDKRDVTGAVISVKEATLREVPAANLTQALQGMASGVQIQRTSPRPGGQAQIRGNRSVGGANAPLLVVDGIPYGGNINDLNPDDIQSLEVLKDASATAIYGSRGANGVILITTKRGKAGKNQIAYSGYVGVNSVRRKYKVYNAQEYIKLKEVSGYTGIGAREDLTGETQTDWQDLMYETGIITNHSLSTSGGTEETQYSIGGGYFNETTVLPGQSFSRFSIRGTIDQKIGKRVKIGLNTMNTFGTTMGENAGAMYGMLSLSPIAPTHDAEGKLILQPMATVEDTYNPLTLKENKDDWIQERKRTRTFNSIYAEVNIIEGLKYRINVGLDWTQDRYGEYYGSNTIFKNGGLNSAAVSNRESFAYTVENLLLYEKTFAEKHKVNFTGLYSFQEDQAVNSRFEATGLPSNQLQYYNFTFADKSFVNTTGGDNGLYKSGVVSYMARVVYSFDNRYVITLTGRADGSSRLAPGKKWNYYPAVSAAWNIDNEAFMATQKVVSSLKLRVGYGQTSNQALNPYQTYGQSAREVYNFGTNAAGYRVSSVPNPNLGWEFTNTLNIGLDFGFLQNRISGSMEIYSQQTEGLLFPQSLPASGGITGSFLNNVGTSENKGFEFNLNAVIFEAKNAGDFSWEINTNVFFNREKLTSLVSGLTRDVGNGWFVGEPIDVIYDYQKIGIWQLGEESEAASFIQKVGEIKVADLDGNGAITAEDRKIIGNYQPKFQGGFTTRFAFKGFDLSINGYYRVGGLITSVLHQPGGYLNMLQGRRSGIKVDFWTPENPTNDNPKPDANRDNPLYGSTLGYFDASFLKIRSINLGYALPSSFLGKIGVSSARVYVTVQNPFVLFSPYLKNTSGVDPEPTGTGGGVGGGAVPSRALTINADTPPTKAFIFGLNFNF
jgi:TonB-dependent starch-binding outer membrane protein SusC